MSRWLACGLVLLASAFSCTEKAKVVPADLCEDELGAGGGAGTTSASCQAVHSPRPGCDECMRRECAAPLQACQCDLEDACACGAADNAVGEATCMLVCEDSRMPPNQCQVQCAHSDDDQLSPLTRNLLTCLRPGPATCPECFVGPGGTGMPGGMDAGSNPRPEQ